MMAKIKPSEVDLKKLVAEMKRLELQTPEQIWMRVILHHWAKDGDAFYSFLPKGAAEDFVDHEAIALFFVRTMTGDMDAAFSSLVRSGLFNRIAGLLDSFEATEALLKIFEKCKKD